MNESTNIVTLNQPSCSSYMCLVMPSMLHKAFHDTTYYDKAFHDKAYYDTACKGQLTSSVAGGALEVKHSLQCHYFHDTAFYDTAVYDTALL